MKLDCLRTVLPTCRRVLLALVPALLLCSCATDFRPAKKNGSGYSDEQVAADQFRVGYKGKFDASLEDAYDFALLRAAQVTLQHGFSCFAVVDVTNTSSVKEFISRDRVYSGALEDPLYGSFFGHPERGTFVTVEQKHQHCRPGTSLLIKCYQSKPETPFTYDAASLQATLKQKHKMKS
ncbi:MAG TPA: hypothetical protein VEC99_01910 [Clostridia bacterium]|nr:hypothetical protein [Clostridia bacterium]